MKQRVFALTAIVGFVAMLASTAFSGAFLSGYGSEAMTALFWMAALWTGLTGLFVAAVAAVAHAVAVLQSRTRRQGSAFA